MVIAIGVELNQWIFRQLTLGPHIFFIPPGDHRRNMQIVGPHQQFDFLGPSTNMKIARPPAFVGQIRKSFHVDRFDIVAKTFHRKVAATSQILGPTLNVKSVIALAQLERHFAIENKMIFPVRQFRNPPPDVLGHP